MSANPRPLVATIYNPHTQSKDALIAGFTARKAKFDRLFRDISEGSMIKAEQHYLIQGVRGMGKTTFLLRLAYEIENTPELAQRLIPIVFNEEEYGISSLADFWERTARYLEEADPTFAGLEDRMAAQYGGDDYERAALQTLLNALHEHDKKLILLIDNIGDLFRKFDDLENKRLREVLLTVPDLRLIGATPTLIEQTHDYSKPYFEFFKVIQLGGLNQEETNDLFLKLGEAYGTDVARELVEKRPGRIEALRRLTGGVIRTMVLLFEIMVENNTGSVFRDLNALIDLVTPLYKHRIDDLPAQQQKIVAALANAWDAANTKELAQVVRLESKVVSAQLKQLINNGIVEKVETNTKNHLYRLEERFFNIWYLMRFGRNTDQRLLWLIRFFEEMFEGEDTWLEERISNLLECMRTGLIDSESALYMTTAFSKILKSEPIEYVMKNATKEFLSNANRNDLLVHLPKSKYDCINDFIKLDKFQKAVNLLNNFKFKNQLILNDITAMYLLLNNRENYLRSVVDLFDKSDATDFIATTLNPEDQYQEEYMTIKALVPFVILKGFVSLLFVTHQDGKVVIEAGKNPYISKNELNDIKAEVAMRYFYLNVVHRADLSMKLIKEIRYNYVELDQDQLRTLVVKYIIMLWNNKFEEINVLIPLNKPIKLKLGNNDKPIDVTPLFFKLLLAKKQYHMAYKYFQQEEWQLKDRFKPLYYATMYFLQDEYPTEYLRMGPELAETVQDILKEVEQMAVDYA